MTALTQIGPCWRSLKSQTPGLARHAPECPETVGRRTR